MNNTEFIRNYKLLVFYILRKIPVPELREDIWKQIMKYEDIEKTNLIEMREAFGDYTEADIEQATKDLANDLAAEELFDKISYERHYRHLR